LFSKILTHAKGLDWRSIRKPYELQTALGFSIIELEQFAIDTLHEVPYTLDEVAKLLDVTVDELISISLRPNINRGEIRFLNINFKKNYFRTKI
jgi:hypothetical protein